MYEKNGCLMYNFNMEELLGKCKFNWEDSKLIRLAHKRYKATTNKET